MTDPEFTTDQLLAGITSAIRAQDVKAAVSIIKLLALQDPHQAEVVYEILKAAADVPRA